MKIRLLMVITAVVFSSLTFHPAAFSQVPGIINYQGRIVDNGTNYTGTGQFEFALVSTGGATNYWSNDGSPVGQPANAVSLTVTKGLYSVLLGNTAVSNMSVAIPAGVFANSNVLLRVWFNDGINGFQQLSPDQQLGVAGYALQAQNAAVAATAIGTSPTSFIQGSGLNIGSGNVVTGQYASVAGGAGNTASGPYAFVGGGTGNQASGTNTTVVGGSGNVASGTSVFVAGGQGNVAIGDYGFIAGGFNSGTITPPVFSPCQFGFFRNYYFLGLGYRLIEDSSYSAVVGGSSNSIALVSDYSFLGGGEWNTIDCMSPESTISGGSSNTIQSSSSDSTIGGGGYSTIQSNTVYATIGGGATNTIQYGATKAIIGGGGNNTIQSLAELSAIGGGGNNTIYTNATYAIIGGGQNNFAGSDHVFVGGGENNTIQSAAQSSTIGGGFVNTIQSNAYGSTIAGGAENTIQSGAESSAIGGGYNNIIQTNAVKSAIGGGAENTIQSYAELSAIAGGAENTIQSYSELSTIGGGSGNTIQSNVVYSTIGGGIQNIIGPVIINNSNYFANADTIGGGAANVISNTYYATIPGGQQAQATNYAQMAYSSGSFSTAGDGQFSLYVLRGEDCSTSATTLYLDYPTDSQEIALPADRACAYTISIVGRESGSVGGSSTTYWMRGLANGETALVENDGANNGTGDLGCTSAGQVTVSGGNMHVRVISINCTTNCMRWVATVQTAEVSYP